jgi:hypothetical protein
MPRLENANRVIDTSFNPSQPAAPVSYIGPSRNPYEPTFGEQLRLKWNRAVESGVENVRETDWTAVGAGVVQGGKDLVGRLNGELPVQSTASSPSASLPSGSDLRHTLDEAKDAVKRGEKKAEAVAAHAVESVQDGATTAGRSVANSSASLLDRLTGAFAGAKSRTDDAVASAQQETQHLASQAKSEAQHLSAATTDAAHRTADAARSAAASASSSVREAAHELHDRISPPPPSTAQHMYDSVTSSLSGAAHKVEDAAHKVEHAVEAKAEELKQATDHKVNHMMAEKRLRGVEEYHEGILKGTSGAGVANANGVDLNKESFTGGSSLGVRARRRAEGTVEGRLV